MTLKTIFNNALKEVKPAAQKLMYDVSTQDWSERKKVAALTIIGQITEGHMLEPSQGFEDECLDFRKLTLIVEPEMLAQPMSTFYKLEDVESATCYVKELISELNQLNSIIKFSYKYYIERSEDKITYKIGWEI